MPQHCKFVADIGIDLLYLCCRVIIIMSMFRFGLSSRFDEEFPTSLTGKVFIMNSSNRMYLIKTSLKVKKCSVFASE